MAEILQEQYDDAMFAFSNGDFDDAIAKLVAILAIEPTHFDAQLALGMAFYRKGDFVTAIAHGHKAEKLKPKEQLVHTNLSLFYMKSGDKKTAEHHGLQARIASWREDKSTPGSAPLGDPDLAMDDARGALNLNTEIEAGAHASRALLGFLLRRVSILGRVEDRRLWDKSPSTNIQAPEKLEDSNQPQCPLYVGFRIRS